jgi:hypothetical protein
MSEKSDRSAPSDPEGVKALLPLLAWSGTQLRPSLQKVLSDLETGRLLVHDTTKGQKVRSDELTNYVREWLDGLEAVLKEIDQKKLAAAFTPPLPPARSKGPSNLKQD